MCAAKTTPRPTLQRVAKHVYRRGDSFEFRKAIPPYARDAFNGVATYSRSFGDVSRREAEHLAAAHRKICDRLIAAAANKPDPTARVATMRGLVKLPEREDIDRAVRAWVLEREEQASTSKLTPEDTRQRVKDLLHMAEMTPVHLRDDRRSSLLETRWIADSIAQVHGWLMPPDGELAQYLHDRVGRAQREAAVRVRAELNYEDQPQPTHRTFTPAAFAGDQEPATQSSNRHVPIMELLERYLAEQRPTAKTAKKWRTALASLIEHLGHDDAKRVVPEDIIAWKNALLTPSKGEEPRSPATVRNGYLGAAKPVFGWAKDNRMVEVNPAAGVTVRVPRRVKNRVERGYNVAEAKLVLAASLATACGDDASYGMFARRWLPWLCAYTGARVVEMAQLRRSDVAEDAKGIWHVTIRPDAGSQKSGQARHVPLHPHLIEQGFTEAITNRAGPLFFDPALKRAGSIGNSQAQKVAQRVADWVRDLGVIDPELQPNHGWRHAFISKARGAIDPDVRRAIVGHANKDEHDAYGEVSLRVMNDAMHLFPRYST